MPFSQIPALARQLHAAGPADCGAHRNLVRRVRKLRDRVREEDASDLAFCLNAVANLSAVLAMPGDRIPREQIHRIIIQIFDSMQPALNALGVVATGPPTLGGTPSEARQAPPTSTVGAPGPALAPNQAAGPKLQMKSAAAPLKSAAAPPRAVNTEIGTGTGGLKLGQILIEFGHTTPEGVAAALKMQEKLGLPLGECMLLSGAASPNHVLNALKLQTNLRGEAQANAQRASGVPSAVEVPGSNPADLRVTQEMFLGEALLGADMITEENLEKAMHIHHNERIRIGEALLKIGAISPEDLEAGIELHARLRKIATLSSADAAARRRGH